MLVVVGTRPEAIKMAPVVRALQSVDDVEPYVVFTGQHTTLVERVLKAMVHLQDRCEHLDIMTEDQSLYDVVHRTLGGHDTGRGLREVVQERRPDMLLVQGDTATVFVASLVGFFEKVPVGHVEAGLRSGDKWAPFPEEVFRRLTDVVADHHFAPTRKARDLLLAENVPARQIHVTGNTVVDALLSVAEQERPVGDDDLREVVEGDAMLVLLTAHRRESFGPPLREVFGAVRRLADELDDVAIVYPVHPNPNVRGPAEELLSDHPRIRLVEPLDYFDLVAAIRHAELVLTDSGGIQEEAPTFGTPVLVLREVTERPEGIEAGVAELVGTEGDRVLERAKAILERARGGRERAGAISERPGTTPEQAGADLESSSSAPASADRRGSAPNPYGDGRAGERIADIVVSELTGRPRRTTDWDGE